MCRNGRKNHGCGNCSTRPDTETGRGGSTDGGTEEKDGLTFDELCDACPWLKKAVDCGADLAKIVIKIDDVIVKGAEFEIAYVEIHIKDNDNAVNYEVRFFMEKTAEVWYINEAYLRDE